jgi:bacteriorhodopsin
VHTSGLTSTHRIIFILSILLIWVSFYGAIACSGIAILIGHTGYRLASVHGKRMKRMYTLCSIDMSILWFGYGIAWGLSEGGNVISPDGEGLFYGILDILGGPVYGILIIWTACQCLCEAEDIPHADGSSLSNLGS